MDITRDFREALDRLATPPESLNAASPAAYWDVWLASQVSEMEELTNVHPHHIRLHERCSTAICEMNCFMFALGIKMDAVRDKCDWSTFPDGKFVSALLKAGILQSMAYPAGQAGNHDIIIYFDEGKPKHAGKRRYGRVVSKWGSGPTHIWKHSTYEVPLTYGNDIRAFRLTADPVKCYRAWATKNGLASQSSL